MRKRKGFIKVVEAIVASIIVLASLTYFFGYHIEPSDWPDSQLKIQSRDSLNVLDFQEGLEKYMQSGDAVDRDNLRIHIDSMVSERIGFAINIIGAPNPVISIACVYCNENEGLIGEKEAIENRTDPFSTISGYDMRGRKLRVAVDNKYAITDINEADEKYDIMFIYGYPDIGFTVDERTEIKEYLENGGNVILFGPLDGITSDDDSFIQDVFGISSFSGNSVIRSSFVDEVNDAGTSASKIYYYYYNLTGRSVLANFNLNANNVDKNINTITHFDDTASIQVNEYENGRTAWVNSYDRSDRNVNSLLQSVLFWLAEDFEIIPTPQFTLTLPSNFFKTYYLMSSIEDSFNMYKVGLTMWYIF
ncbi:hypothetical protein CL614_07475 [archaeon]|nr:hypothetical protein [archaeon]|tara:strand:- start:1983 stop:3068 length:1086 start_codon:yes stop_codon:yes gene_type:complete